MPSDKKNRQGVHAAGDSGQYTVQSIRDYETIYGKDFVSPGGKEIAFELISKLDLKPMSRVLDVGCGLGGSAFVMALEFGLVVDGIDLSPNMLTLAAKRVCAQGLQEKVNLSLQDCLNLDQPQWYDAIYSRDVFLHIADKSRLLEVLRSTLKKSGQLLFTDYCSGERPWSPQFSNYVKNRGYSLHTISEYEDLLSNAGFNDIQSEDLTSRFIEILWADLETIAESRMANRTKQKLESGWRAKLNWANSGDHRWGLFTAVA